MTPGHQTTEWRLVQRYSAAAAAFALLGVVLGSLHSLGLGGVIAGCVGVSLAVPSLVLYVRHRTEQKRVAAENTAPPRRVV